MGYDVGRSDELLDDESICPLCLGIFRNPVKIPNCGHIFCKKCLETWCVSKDDCPLDRVPHEKKKYVPVPRVVDALIGNLQLSCEFAEYGCDAKRAIKDLPDHEKTCQFNPKQVLVCLKGCSMPIPRKDYKNHNCLEFLKKFIEEEKTQIKNLENELGKISSEQKQESNELNMQFVRLQSPTFMDWVHGLDKVSIKNWKFLISEPDFLLQRSTLRNLVKLGCPQVVARQLVNNSSEKNWPQDMKNLSFRINNEKNFENYYLRKIKNKQAVVAMEIDNNHMMDLWMVSPGIVFHFTEGVE